MLCLTFLSRRNTERSKTHLNQGCTVSETDFLSRFPNMDNFNQRNDKQHFRGGMSLQPLLSGLRKTYSWFSWLHLYFSGVSLSKFLIFKLKKLCLKSVEDWHTKPRLGKVLQHWTLLALYGALAGCFIFGEKGTAEKRAHDKKGTNKFFIWFFCE